MSKELISATVLFRGTMRDFLDIYVLNKKTNSYIDENGNSQQYLKVYDTRFDRANVMEIAQADSKKYYQEMIIKKGLTEDAINQYNFPTIEGLSLEQLKAYCIYNNLVGDEE